MNKVISLLFFIFVGISAFAQYDKITVEKNTTNIKIMQVDYFPQSVVLHCEYKNQGLDWMNINENVSLKGQANKEYHLLNSYNLPINGMAENKNMIFDKPDQVHRFSLEFEKIPFGEKFDMIEDINSNTAFNIYGICVDTISKVNYLDINSFTKDYPVKERSMYLKDGNSIYNFKYKGLELQIILYLNSDYGRYFQVQYDLKNFMGKSVLFSPDAISAYTYDDRRKKNVNLHVLSYDEYAKKIKRRQTWNSIFYGLSEGLAAAGAGYSSSTTEVSGNSTTDASAYAYGSNGWATAYGSSYTTSYAKSHTISYDGAAAYWAQQNAQQKANDFDNEQYVIRNRLTAGYGKANTIRNQEEYAGYFNIKYQKTNNLMISFNINGEIFNFPYFWKEPAKF